jgi:threonine aldolase
LGEVLVRSLQERGWRFYKFLEPDVHRLMCSWATSDKHITEFVDDVRSLQSS